MNLLFRKATTQDIPLIAELADSIWRKHYINIITLQQIEYMLKSMYSTESLLQQMTEGHVFTIVFADEKPIGFASINRKDKGNYTLHKFYISPDYHGNSIGTKLFINLLSELNPFESIQLTVNRQNYKAINFYFKIGFIIKEIADFNIGNGFFMNDFVMIKRVPVT
ncbi:MAG: GNAT family N-acetyltransferase [Bacteroidota bacterium]